MSERPRLLLVPQLTGIEWTIRPLLEEWADVATYDAPGVGDEPAVDDFGPAAVAERGEVEVDRLGWERFIIVADEYGVLAAVQLASARRESVRGLALGHACLSNRTDGDRAPVDGEMQAALALLIKGDDATWARHLTQLSGGSYDEELSDRYIERVPRELGEHFFGASRPPSESLEAPLRTLGTPMLFARHAGCILYTQEGFEDAAAAFPDAQVAVTDEKPSTSPAFAEAIKSFCQQIESGEQ